MSGLSGNWLKNRSVTETGRISWKKMGSNKESKGALRQAKSRLNSRSVRLAVTSAELGMPALTDNTIIMMQDTFVAIFIFLPLLIIFSFVPVHFLPLSIF